MNPEEAKTKMIEDIKMELRELGFDVEVIVGVDQYLENIANDPHIQKFLGQFSSDFQHLVIPEDNKEIKDGVYAIKLTDSKSKINALSAISCISGEGIVNNEKLLVYLYTMVTDENRKKGIAKKISKALLRLAHQQQPKAQEIISTDLTKEGKKLIESRGPYEKRGDLYYYNIDNLLNEK